MPGDVYGSMVAGASGAASMQAKADTASSDEASRVHRGAVTRKDVLSARKGLPVQAKQSAWMWLAGVDAKRAAAPVSFHQLACCDRVPDDILYAIEDDCRTMSLYLQHPMFTTTRGVDALSRLLMAFYQRNPDSGYIRGHTARLGALVLVVHGVRNVEDAFWNFCALVEDRLYGHCGGQILLGTALEQRAFERLVLKKLPIVAYHLSKLSLPLSTLTQGWFSSCFVSVLAADTATRIMDSLMAEGSKILHRVALALLKRHAAAIVSCTRGDCLRKVLEARMARATDVEELMQTAFSWSLPGALLKSFRDTEFKNVEAELQKAKERNDLPGTWISSMSSGLTSYGRSGSSRSLASGRSVSSSGRSE